MAFRWSKGFSPVQTIKRGIASLFVCTIVLLPLITFGVQLYGWLGTDNDPREVGTVSALQVRSIDNANGDIKPFEQPLITVTFDDGWESIYSQALPLLQKYGIVTTQYVLAGTGDDHNYLSFAQIKAMREAGHEIACHSVDHSNLTQLSVQQLHGQLVDCQTIVQTRVGGNVREFASPYGAFNDTTIKAIKETYRSHRNTNGDITTNAADDQDVNVKATFNRYNITAVTIRRDTTEAQLQAIIDYTVKNNAWLVLNYHQIDDAGSNFGLDAAALERQLQTIAQANARIVTVGQTLDAMGY